MRDIEFPFIATTRKKTVKQRSEQKLHFQGLIYRFTHKHWSRAIASSWKEKKTQKIQKQKASIAAIVQVHEH